MLKAIKDYQIEGIKTTLPFGSFVFEHQAFRSGQFNTNFVKEYYAPDVLKTKHEEEANIAALIALKHYLEDQEILRLPN